MATTPTNLPVPSESPRDAKFNAGKIDEFVTSLSLKYKDRFGGDHYTIEGLRQLAQQAIAAYGWVPMDSFQDGATLTLPNQVLRWKLPDGDGDYYRWDGAFPKKVDPASTPATSGGVGVGKWLSVSDAVLRSQLAGAGGAGMIGTNSGINVQENLDNLEHNIELNTNNIELISNTINNINNRILGVAKCERKSSMGGLYYHVVKIPKGVGNISKEYGSTPIFVSGVMHVAKISPSAYSKISPAGAISNGDGWREWVTDGNGNYQPWGLQIANGVAYQDFTPYPGDNNHGVQALLLQKDGSVIPAELSDGKTAQQYVDEGAIASFGFHWILVKNGAAYQSDADPDIRPRTVFGVYPDGTYCILQVQGKASTYGMTYNDLQALCISEGLYHAIVMDGGGSTQLLWENTYLQPSSDGAPRPVAGGFISVNTPIQEFDSGWKSLAVDPAVVSSGSIFVRQVGSEIKYRYNFTLKPPTTPSTAYTVVNQSTMDKSRYLYLGSVGSSYSTWVTPLIGSLVGQMKVYEQGATTIGVQVFTTSAGTNYIGQNGFTSRYAMTEFG